MKVLDPLVQGEENKIETGPEVIKLFFMLNSAKHEILHAQKY